MGASRLMRRMRVLVIEVIPLAVAMYAGNWFMSRVAFDRSPWGLPLVLITGFLLWRAAQAWRLSDSLVERGE